MTPASKIKCMVFIIDPISAFPPFFCSLASPWCAATTQRHESMALCNIWGQHTLPHLSPGTALQFDPSIVLQPRLEGSGLALHIQITCERTDICKIQHRGHYIMINRAFCITSRGCSNNSSPSRLCFPFLSYWHIFPFAVGFDGSC